MPNNYKQRDFDRESLVLIGSSSDWKAEHRHAGA